MKNSGKEASIASAIFFLLSGPILWAGHLFLVYAVQSATCAIASRWVGASQLIQASVVLATLAATMLLLLLLCFPRRVARLLRYETDDRHSQVFSLRVARLLNLLALMGVIWTASGALLLDTCSPLR